MNALQNMECVKNGNCSLKEQSIIAMNNFLSSAYEHVRQSWDAAKQAAAKQQIADVNQKAESLPDVFFAGIDCEWNKEGKAILAAVLQA
ncbi:MAG TPA: hypothetical protein PLC58_14715 [Denitromonas sp.]|nr:hypothetical protein [Denitromonas sp.]